MPIVTVKPIQTVNVRVNQRNQQVTASTSQFVGSGITPAEIQRLTEEAENASATANTALSQVNAALTVAQNAYDAANTKLNITGGEITGNLIVDGTLTNANNVVDAGLF